MKRTLYFAKEPDLGVLNDLSRISEELVVVDCLSAYSDYYRKRGYNCISLSEFFKLDRTMLFNYVLGNPPFQSNNGNGDLSGSGTGALWWKITQKSISLLKPGGTLSLITPTNILNGGDAFSKLILGPERKIDLVKVSTNVNEYFPSIGIKVCHWTAKNSLTTNNQCVVDQKVSVNTDKTLKIYNDHKFQDIIHTLFYSDREKFDISIKDAARVVSISKLLQKRGYTESEADEISKDYSPVQTDQYPYPYNSNGKIKYGKVKWITHGTWKMMIPHMGTPFKYEIIVSDTMVSDQSCDVQFFNSEEEALKAKKVLDDPIYRWIIEKIRISGRISTAILTRFPNAPIEEVLTEEQLSYIKSQL